MEEQKNDKRLLRVELDGDVKQVIITGKNSDEKVVMKQVLNEVELDQATGGFGPNPFFLPDNPLPEEYHAKPCPFTS